MFDARSTAAGVAALSGVTATLAGAPPAAAAPLPAPDPAGASQVCVIRALPVAAVERGERSPSACAPTAAQARAILDGRATTSSFDAAAAFAAPVIAYFYDNASGAGVPWLVEGDCAKAVNLPPEQDNRVSAVALLGCSSVKMYKGYNFTDASTVVRGSLGYIQGLPPEFDNQTSSVKFGA